MPPITKADSTQPVIPRTIEPVAPKVEVGAAAAMKRLDVPNAKPGSISGGALADALSKGLKDPQAAGKEYATVKKFVESHGKQLSPEAKKVFEVYSKQVELSKANQQTGIDFRSMGKLQRDMHAAARTGQSGGAAQTLNDLASRSDKPGSITGKEMTDTILRATKDVAAQSKEHSDISKFVKENGPLLSPDAKAAFGVYDQATQASEAKGQPAIEKGDQQKMARELAKYTGPIATHPNPNPPVAAGHEHGFAVSGAGKGKADLGDKLEYGNVANKDGPNHQVLKSKDLDPTIGNYQGPIDPATKQPTVVKTSPLKMTHESLDKALEKELGGKDKFSFKPPFKDPGGPEAAQAKMALLNAPIEKGAEHDVIVAMGTESSRKPILMTTRTDKSGNVVAEIVGDKMPVVAKKFATVEEAKAAIKTDFGMDVASAPTTAAGRAADPTLKDWSLEELNKTHDALSRMSPKEKLALDGVKLERRTTIPGQPTFAAMFRSQLSHDPTTKEPFRKDVMMVADSGFAADDKQFVGGAKNPTFPSVRTIVHEAGHAVADKEQRTAQLANEKAKFNYKEALVPHGAVARKWDTAYGKLKAPEKESAKAFNTALKDLETKRAALAAAPADKVTERYDAVIKAQNKLTDESNKLPAKHPARAEATAVRDSASNMGLGYAKTAADSGKTLADSQVGTEAARHAKFDKYVKDNKIPLITDYSHSDSGHEHFAEAYSLYKTDPEWMKANSPLLHKYFEDNKHLD